MACHFFSELCSVFLFLSGREEAPVSNIQRWWEWPMSLTVIYLQIIGLNSFFNGDIIYNTKSLLTRFLAQVCSYRRIVPDLRTLKKKKKTSFWLLQHTSLLKWRMCNLIPCLNQLKLSQQTILSYVGEISAVHFLCVVETQLNIQDKISGEGPSCLTGGFSVCVCPPMGHPPS